MSVNSYCRSRESSEENCWPVRLAREASQEDRSRKQAKLCFSDKLELEIYLTEGQRQRDRDRETERQRDRETETERQRQRDRDRERGRE